MIATVVLSLLLFVIFAAVIRFLIRRRQIGGCLGCPHAKDCPKSGDKSRHCD